LRISPEQLNISKSYDRHSLDRRGKEGKFQYHTTLQTPQPLRRFNDTLALTHKDEGRAAELTAYLAESSYRRVIKRETSADGGVMGHSGVATHRSKVRLESNHEEANTELVLHALDSSSSGDTVLGVHSPNRGILVLILRRYSALCQNAAFVTGVGENYRDTKLDPTVFVVNADRAGDTSCNTGRPCVSGRRRPGLERSTRLRHVSANLRIIPYCVEDSSVFPDFLTLATCVILTL